MNKLFFTSLFLLFSSLSFFGQKRDYLAEMYANHHGIAQKAGTNNLLKEFIKPYGKKGEVFAILFAPQACPRCEVDIPYVLENLPKIKPQAELVIIAAYHDSILAKQYIEKKFKAPNVIIDTEGMHEKIFHYRTGRLAVTYMLQIDAEQGRLMCGGDTPNMSEGFLSQFCNNTSYCPYSEIASGGVEEVDSEPAQRLANGTYASVLIETDNSFNVSSITELPDWYGNSFIYSDELSSSVLLFSVDKDTARLSRKIIPTEVQKTAFVDIPRKQYEEMERQGQVFIMANCCALNPSGKQAIASFSLPDLSMENDTTIAYYNKAVLLYADAGSDTCQMSAFDFEHEASPLYMYTHASRIMPVSKTLVMFGCRKGFPTCSTGEECKNDKEQDIFMREFYDNSPFLAIFNRTSGKRTKRFGRLPDVFRKSMTGYYFTLPIAATYQDLLAYSDGCSGKLWLTDKFGEDRQQEFDLFHVDIPDSVLAIAAPLRYTDSYFEPFIAIFHQYIEMIKLDKQGIHCLIRNGKSAVKKENDQYEYRLLDYNGKMEKSFNIKLEEGDEMLAISLGKDKEGNVFPYYVCKNNARFYLKLPERK